MVNGPAEFCIERSRLLTDFLVKKGGFDYIDPFIRQAESLFYILKNKKPKIFPYDLLAGSTTSKRKGVLLYPELGGLKLFPELLKMPFRKNNPYIIKIEEVEEFNDVLAFWMDKSILELVRQKIEENDISYDLHTQTWTFIKSQDHFYIFIHNLGYEFAIYESWSHGIYD